MTRSIPALTWLALCVTSGCATDTEAGDWTLTNPDRAQFEREVYPVLLRDCAFHACHGSTERFLQAFGPGRGRLSSLTRPLDPQSPDEVTHSYDRARSLIDGVAPERSLLLRKPLAVEAGGCGHEGADSLGRNVYESVQEPGYAALARWIWGPVVPPAP